jgi:hypothetical protein
MTVAAAVDTIAEAVLGGLLVGLLAVLTRPKR